MRNNIIEYKDIYEKLHQTINNNKKMNGINLKHFIKYADDNVPKNKHDSFLYSDKVAQMMYIQSSFYKMLDTLIKNIEYINEKNGLINVQNSIIEKLSAEPDKNDIKEMKSDYAKYDENMSDEDAVAAIKVVRQIRINQIKEYIKVITEQIEKTKAIYNDKVIFFNLFVQSKKSVGEYVIEKFEDPTRILY